MSTKETNILTLPEETLVGNYFVANYPPFSVWTKEGVEQVARPALEAAPVPGNPLGLYLHIPFCRKRCHFCYYRVYTDKNAEEIAGYLDLLASEMELYARFPAVEGRPLNFIYFGGGTPSYLSTRQLESLVKRLGAIIPWRAEEITFECEPGTLTDPKLAAIREMGVTRLSLGIENFDDRVLAMNGRAHRSGEIFRAYETARRLGFPQINIDLLAGMLGETDENWQACIEAVLRMAPDSVTIYQMELPFNTTISGDLRKGTGQFADAPANWPTKRRWVQEAFEAFEHAGYHVGSAYTAVKDPARTRFLYRDRLWEGADMVALGVASFGHMNGTHLQNFDQWEPYGEAIRRGELPLSRAYRPTEEERMIRELVLQLKLGSVRPAYFAKKYHVDILKRFADQFRSLTLAGYLEAATEEVVSLSREGLLRIDALLPRFFLPQHVGIRYS